MRALALVVSLLVAAGCGAPRLSSEADPGAVSADPKQVLLETRYVDARQGESFTLGQFSGKVVIVLGIAVW